MGCMQFDRCVAALIAAAGWPLATLADTIHVAPCGNDTWTGETPNCASPDGPKATIQAAIDAATSGDIVLVAPGIYTGAGNRDMDFGGKAMTVQSENGPDTCTIDVDADAGDMHRAFHFHNAETADSVLEGFTITNGYMAPRGGAMLIEAGSAPMIRECVFTDNSVDANIDGGGGGAVYVLVSDPTFIGCTFGENFVALNNTGTGGAAIYNSDSSPTISGCQFLSNMISGPNLITGGGAVVNASASFPVIVDCHFEANSSSSDAGAVINVGGAHPTLTQCTFVQNSAGRIGGAVGSGLEGAGATFNHCEFINNSAVSLAAGAYAGFDGPSSFFGCRFIGNTASLDGGAVYLQDAEATFTACEFIGNVSDEAFGGGVEFWSATGTFINCLFADNFAQFSGAGLWAGNASIVDVVNCTFTENIAMFDAGAVLAEGNAVVSVANTIVWDNVAPTQIAEDGGTVNVTYSNIQGGWAGTGNTNCDPLFADADAGDFHPLATCVTDSGDNCAVPEDIDTDLDGNSRFVNYPGAPDVGNGCEGIVKYVDMGPYERLCAADANSDGLLNILDFVAFQSIWLDQEPGGDCDDNGMFNILDFICFQQAFQAGCS